jgi:uncharacterized Fe-S cluster-containing radical SAM superfamily enzyme
VQKVIYFVKPRTLYRQVWQRVASFIALRVQLSSGRIRELCNSGLKCIPLSVSSLRDQDPESLFGSVNEVKSPR